MIDLVVFFILLASFLFGLWRGLFREVLSLGALALSIGGGMGLGWLLQPLIARQIPRESAAKVISFSVVFLTLLVTLSIVISLLRKKLFKDKISLGDHFAGGAFGILRAVLALSLMAFFLVPMIPENLDIARKSATWPILTRAAEVMSDLAPTSLLVAYHRRQEDLIGELLASDSSAEFVKNPEILKENGNLDVKTPEGQAALRKAIDIKALAEFLHKNKASESTPPGPTDNPDGPKAVKEQMDAQTLQQLLDLLEKMPDTQPEPSAPEKK